MSTRPQRFPEALESRFQRSRKVALAQINVQTFWLVALLVMLFSGWDWYVDPAHWANALYLRTGGAIAILATGIVQRLSGRVDWAPALAKIRFGAAVIAVAAALAVLDNGFLVGVAGLVSVLLAGPYIALDRRDLLVMNALPLAAIALILYVAGIDRFAVVNATIFILLAVAVSLMLARVLEATNRRAFALEQDLMQEARTDSLTGLRNRRALEEAAGAELRRTARSEAPISVIICDIDQFKHVNDRYGHDAGDRVIRAVAEQLASVARATDVLARWGGEEFLALLPNTHPSEAAILAERMRRVVAEAVMPVAPEVRVTISLGVAGLEGSGVPDHSARWDHVVREADDAMYRAKAAGRNRVVAADTPRAAA
jgi:diguanylate cyclase (GGDEF)-like protein